MDVSRQAIVEAGATSVGLSRNPLGDSTVRIDGSDSHKVAELAQLLPMQLITPEGFTLLNGGPKYWHGFLDWGCFHNEPAFFTAWGNLRRLLKQHNAALRQVNRYQQLLAWDERSSLAAANRYRLHWRSLITPESALSTAEY